MRLPIEHVPGTNPPKFRWRQVVAATSQVIHHEGNVEPRMEVALLRLINLCQEQEKEIAALKKQVEGHCERIAAQSELLSQSAEKPQPGNKEQAANMFHAVIEPQVPKKKGK